MPRNFPRSERVEKLAREVLAEAIRDLKDPRVGFATVTKVKISPDLRQATVFISILGSDEQRSDSMQAIRGASSHLRTLFGREVRLKYLPALEFVEDLTAQTGDRIDNLLKQVKPSVEEAQAGDE